MILKSSIIETIKALPPLPVTIIEINSIYADKNSNIKDMAKAIEKDPMIVANILKAANSPLYGFGREIKNVTQAVALFGINMIRSIAIGNSIRKLLNVDMQPYGVTSEEFAYILSLQSSLLFNWYKKIDKQKAEELYLAAFLQETGKILIASEVIQNNEIIHFLSEVENSNNLAIIEKAYANATSAEVTAMIFEHWGFEANFVDMIRYSDDPSLAPSDIKEYATALNIIKTIVPLNKPFYEISINLGVKTASDSLYDTTLLQDSIQQVMSLK